VAQSKYAVNGDVAALDNNPMAIMLRSHKLQVAEVMPTVRCIARCGAGTNNIPVAEMTAKGIPVFNTPGANANAVKELVVCSLLLASRGVMEGHIHVNDKINVEEGMDYDKVSGRLHGQPVRLSCRSHSDSIRHARGQMPHRRTMLVGPCTMRARRTAAWPLSPPPRARLQVSKRIEKDKAMFVGQEISGKTLGVVGLGQIGARVVEAALALGMKVVGYDPVLSVEAALMLPGDRMQRVDKLEQLLAQSDYITLHTPYIKGVTHHLLNPKTLAACKPGVSILNFARGEIVDGAAVKVRTATGQRNKWRIESQLVGVFGVAPAGSGR
jgi:phosphoglycerate dehydrogenase-like enzyme